MSPRLLAAIDVGTNSFHMIVARVSSTGAIEVVTREKEVVRLGRGGGDMKQLDPEAMERGLAALKRMRQIADGANAPLRAVATSAVREAANAKLFLHRARTEAGVEIEVVSGVEEARLIHLGVLQALPVFSRRILVCDIGGGSTELVVAQGGEPVLLRSLKMGAVRLTDRFFAAGTMSPVSRAACNDFVASALAPMRRLVAQHGFDTMIVSSGTAEAMTRLAWSLDGGRNQRSVNGIETSAASLRKAVELIIRTPANERANLPGIDTKRAEIIAAGALILDGVVTAMEARSITFSEYALREGILIDTIGRTEGEAMHHLRDVSLRGVRHLMQACDDEPTHAEQVAQLAVGLFDETQLIHGLTPTSREYLEAAGLLANVGLFIGHSRHHLHSYYIIRNAETLSGFTDHEIEIIALIARYHRKGAPKFSHAEFAQLDAADGNMVRLLAGLLRIAIGLDRRHDGRVRSVSVSRLGEGLHITPVVDDGVDTSLEVYAASERTSLLAAALDRKITVGTN